MIQYFRSVTFFDFLQIVERYATTKITEIFPDCYTFFAFFVTVRMIKNIGINTEFQISFMDYKKVLAVI